MPDAKNKGALKTIGEVASQVGVATHVLRFWEDNFTQIKPQKRRGRRYYSTEDISAIQTIKTLLYDQGYTIKGVHKFLKNSTMDKHPAKSRIIPDASTPEHNVEPDKNHLPQDLFGGIIIENNHGKTPLPKFGTSEITRLKHIHASLCTARNKLHLL